MNCKRYWPALILLVFPLSACEVEEPARELEPGLPAEEVPGVPHEAPMLQEYPIEVENTTDQPMNISAEVNDQTRELGIVGPNETAQYSIRAEPGSEIKLEAKDAQGRTHSSGSVTAGAPEAAWRIQQR